MHAPYNLCLRLLHEVTANIIIPAPANAAEIFDVNNKPCNTGIGLTMRAELRRHAAKTTTVEVCLCSCISLCPLMYTYQSCIAPTAAKHHFDSFACGLSECSNNVQATGVPVQQQLLPPDEICKFERQGASIVCLQTSWHPAASGAMLLRVYALNGAQLRRADDIDGASGLRHRFSHHKVRGWYPQLQLSPCALLPCSNQKHRISYELNLKCPRKLVKFAAHAHAVARRPVPDDPLRSCIPSILFKVLSRSAQAAHSIVKVTAPRATKHTNRAKFPSMPGPVLPWWLLPHGARCICRLNWTEDSLKRSKAAAKDSATTSRHPWPRGATSRALLTSTLPCSRLPSSYSHLPSAQMRATRHDRRGGTRLYARHSTISTRSALKAVAQTGSR